MLPPATLAARQTPQRASAKVAIARELAALGSAWLVVACGAGATPLEQAVLLSEKGQDPRAIALLQSDLAKHPDETNERRLLVRLYGVTGDLGGAERSATELAKHLPAESPVPWLELGHAMELGHRYEEALALYDRAAAVAPKDPSGPKTGGLRAARWGELELAAPRLEEALRRDSRDAEVWHALGLVRLQSDDFDGAKVAYNSGLVADPSALENRIGLATLALRRKDPALALAEYDRVIASRPEFAAAHVGRAWALLLLGRLDEARAALQEAERRGGDPRVIARQRRFVEAVAARRKAAR